MTARPAGADEAARRRLLGAWSLLVGLAWLSSRELLDALALPRVFALLLAGPHPAAREAAGAAGLAVGGAGAVLLAALAAGRALAGLVRRRDPIVALAAGLAPLGLAAQGLGLAGLAQPGTLRAATLALAAVGALRLRRTRRSRRGAAGGPIPAAACAVAAALVLLAACAPEGAWDAVVYHLRVPALYLHDHRIAPVPEIFPSFFPFTGEMLLMLAAALGGDPAARMLHAAIWLACGAAVSRLGGSRWGAALFLTIPFGMAIAARAYVEYFLLLPFLASLLLLRAGGRQGPGRLALAGWLAGSAFTVKYLGGFCAAVAFGVAATAAPPRRLVLFAAAGCLPGLPWLLRTFLWTGNPVFPVLLGGPRWTPADAAGWADDARAFRPHLRELLAMPWTLMRRPASDGALSPLLVAGLAAPVLFPPLRRPGLLRPALALALVWWVTAPLPRYLTPALALACAALAGAAAGARPAARLLTGLGFAGCLLCGAKAIEFGTGVYDPALGCATARAYRGRFFSNDLIPALEALERRLGTRERAYVLGSFYAPGLDRRAWFDFNFIRPPLYWWVHDAPDAERVRVRARQAGLTHVAWLPVGALHILATRPELSGWTPRSLAVWRAYWTRHATPVERVGPWTIFALGPPHAPRPVAGDLPGTEAVFGPARLRPPARPAGGP